MADVRVGVKIQAAIEGLAQVRQMVQSIDGLGTEGQSAARELDALTRELEEIARTQGLIQTFKQQKQALAEVSREYANARQRSSELGQALKQTADPTRRQTQEFEKARAATRQFAQAQQQAQQALQQSRGALQQAGVSTQQLATAQRQLSTRSTEANSKLQSLNTQVKQLAAAKPAPDVTKNLRSGADRAGGAIRGVTQLLGAIGVTVGLAQVIGQFTSAAKTAAQFERALTAITGSAKEAEAAQQRLSDLAEKYGTEIVGLEKSYISWRAAVEGSNIAAEESEEIFEAVVGTMGALGRSSADTEGALLALQQMVSKNTVSMEELRQQLGERLPGAFKLAADALGVTTEELAKMVENGQVLAEDLLPLLARGLKEAYSLDTIERVETLSAAQGRLSNSTVELFRAFDEATGASGALREAIDWLAGYVSSAGEVWKSYAQDQSEATFEINEAADASERAALQAEAQAAAQEKLRKSAQDLKTTVDDLVTGYDAWREQQEAAIEVAEAERQAREALISLYGDETKALDEVVRAAGERAEAARLEAERLGELASAAATYAVQLRFELEAREENTKAQEQALVAAEQDAQIKRDQYDASTALAEALATEAVAQDVAREAVEDNSARLDELGAAYETARARVEELEQAQRDGIDVTTELTAARREEAKALGLYNDALADTVENLKRAAEFQERSNNLVVIGIDAKIAEVKATKDIAEAQGRERAAREALVRIKELEADRAAAIAQAKREETQAARELVEALILQAEADGEVTEAERLAIEAAEASVKIKEIETRISEANAKAKQAEAGAARDLADAKNDEADAGDRSAEASRKAGDAAEESGRKATGGLLGWKLLNEAQKEYAREALGLGGIVIQQGNEFDEAAVRLTRLAEQYEQAYFGLSSYAEVLRRAARENRALADAQRAAGDETVSYRIRLAELRGEEEEVLRLRQQQIKAQLELELLQAQTEGDLERVKQIKEVIRLQAEVAEEEKKQWQERQQEREREGNALDDQEKTHGRIGSQLNKQIGQRREIAYLEEQVASRADTTAKALDRQAAAGESAKRSIQSLGSADIGQLQRSIDALVQALQEGIGRGAQQARADIQALDAVDLRNLRGELAGLTEALTTDLAAGVRAAVAEMGKLNSTLLSDLRSAMTDLGRDLADSVSDAQRQATSRESLDRAVRQANVTPSVSIQPGQLAADTTAATQKIDEIRRAIASLAHPSNADPAKFENMERLIDQTIGRAEILFRLLEEGSEASFDALGQSFQFTAGEADSFQAFVKQIYQALADAKKTNLSSDLVERARESLPSTAATTPTATDIGTAVAGALAGAPLVIQIDGQALTGAIVQQLRRDAGRAN